MDDAHLIDFLLEDDFAFAGLNPSILNSRWLADKDSLRDDCIVKKPVQKTKPRTKFNCRLPYSGLLDESLEELMNLITKDTGASLLIGSESTQRAKSSQSGGAPRKKLKHKGRNSKNIGGNMLPVFGDEQPARGFAFNLPVADGADTRAEIKKKKKNKRYKERSGASKNFVVSSKKPMELSESVL